MRLFSRFLDSVSRPSPAVVLGFGAFFISLGGGAIAASTLVNIADPISGVRARVTNTGELQVEAQQASPKLFFHTPIKSTFGNCVELLRVPANRALIVKQIRVNLENTPASPGVNDVLVVYSTANCSGLNTEIAAINPSGGGVSGNGPVVIPFDPGLALAPRAVLSARTGGLSGHVSGLMGITSGRRRFRLPAVGLIQAMKSHFRVRSVSLYRHAKPPLFFAAQGRPLRRQAPLRTV